MTTEKKDQGKKGTFTRGGFLPADHWLFGAGPIVAGRTILQLHRPWTAERREEILADARAAIARGNPKPTESD